MQLITLSRLPPLHSRFAQQIALPARASVATAPGRMSRVKLGRRLLTVLLAISLLVSCRSPQVTSADITISITADGESRNITILAGSTVTQALQSAGVT